MVTLVGPIIAYRILIFATLSSIGWPEGHGSYIRILVGPIIGTLQNSYMSYQKGHGSYIRTLAAPFNIEAYVHPRKGSAINHTNCSSYASTLQGSSIKPSIYGLD